MDGDFDVLTKLAHHAHHLVNRFIETSNKDRHRAAEMLVELEHVIDEFNRLRPPPLFRKERALHLVSDRLCAICGVSAKAGNQEFFETPGAVYHVDCYERETGKCRSKI